MSSNMSNATYGRKLQQFGLFEQFWAPAAEAVMDFFTPFSLPFLPEEDEGNYTSNYSSSGRRLLGMDDLLLVEVRNVPARSAPVASP